MPLKLATYLGLAIAVLAAIYLLEVVVKTLILGNEVAGYPSLMAVVLFMGGAQLVTLGVIGEYLGRIFNETKQRPLYFVERHLRGMAIVPGLSPPSSPGLTRGPPQPPEFGAALGSSPRVMGGECGGGRPRVTG
jgi:hypothetical protein